MTDTEKKSASSHEEYRGDSEKGANVSPKANISARSVYPRCCRGLVLVPYLLFPLGRIKNPLSGIPKAQLLSDVETFAREKDMMDVIVLLKKGALVAQDPPSFETIEELDEDDKTTLRREITHKWSQPRTMYLTVALCSIGAAVQYARYPFSNFGFDR